MNVSGKGSIALENSLEAAIQGLKLFGRSSQNGVPSPASPLWINNAGDNGTIDMLTNIPKSDKEKYLHVAIGGTVEEMPNPDACLLNYWMNEWLKKLGKV